MPFSGKLKLEHKLKFDHASIKKLYFPWKNDRENDGKSMGKSYENDTFRLKKFKITSKYLIWMTL